MTMTTDGVTTDGVIPDALDPGAPAAAGRECCDEARRAAGFSRRTLLKAAGAGAGAVVVSPLAGMQVAYGAVPSWTGDTIVVLSLRGGFDGLNAVAPVSDPDYRALRPNLHVPQSKAVQLDARFGLHPAMTPLKALWDRGDLAIVHAAGLPQPNRSHFEAMEQMERAVPGSSARSGWLDRVIGLHSAAGPFGAVQLGSNDIPYALHGPHPQLGMWSLGSFRLDAAGNTQERARWRTALETLHSGSPTPVRAATRTTLAALDTAATLAGDQSAPGGGAQYPDGHLGRVLRDTARLIKADIGVRVITLDAGDWDMHANAGNVDGGWMYDNFRELARALRAFADDLGPVLDRTTLVTISEFGRTSKENDSGGVDHGWANAMFVLGGNVNTGTVHGSWPGLKDQDQAPYDLRVRTDYRAVLADVLVNRVKASSTAVRTVFPGYTGRTLGITRT